MRVCRFRASSVTSFGVQYLFKHSFRISPAGALCGNIYFFHFYLESILICMEDHFSQFKKKNVPQKVIIMRLKSQVFIKFSSTFFLQKWAFINVYTHPCIHIYTVNLPVQLYLHWAVILGKFLLVSCEIQDSVPSHNYDLIS